VFAFVPLPLINSHTTSQSHLHRPALLVPRSLRRPVCAASSVWTTVRHDIVDSYSHVYTLTPLVIACLPCLKSTLEGSHLRLVPRPGDVLRTLVEHTPLRHIRKGRLCFEHLLKHLPRSPLKLWCVVAAACLPACLLTIRAVLCMSATSSNLAPNSARSSDTQARSSAAFHSDCQSSLRAALQPLLQCSRSHCAAWFDRAELDVVSLLPKVRTQAVTHGVLPLLPHSQGTPPLPQPPPPCIQPR
jgi:hypothetical protein